jgi:hypothetical protein
MKQTGRVKEGVFKRCLAKDEYYGEPFLEFEGEDRLVSRVTEDVNLRG